MKNIELQPAALLDLIDNAKQALIVSAREKRIESSETDKTIISFHIRLSKFIKLVEKVVNKETLSTLEVDLLDQEKTFLESETEKIKKNSPYKEIRNVDSIVRAMDRVIELIHKTIELIHTPDYHNQPENEASILKAFIKASNIFPDLFSEIETKCVHKTNLEKAVKELRLTCQRWPANSSTETALKQDITMATKTLDILFKREFLQNNSKDISPNMVPTER